jgi:hypothetical protein
VTQLSHAAVRAEEGAAPAAAASYGQNGPAAGVEYEAAAAPAAAVIQSHDGTAAFAAHNDFENGSGLKEDVPTDRRTQSSEAAAACAAFRAIDGQGVVAADADRHHYDLAGFIDRQAAGAVRGGAAAAGKGEGHGRSPDRRIEEGSFATGRSPKLKLNRNAHGGCYKVAALLPLFMKPIANRRVK